MDQKIPMANILTLRARFAQAAADAAKTEADAVKPKMFATREEREPYDLALDHERAQRARHARLADAAANEILAAAGFRGAHFRRK